MLANRQGLIRVLEERFPDEKAKALVNWPSQVWPFVKDMANGDWVVMPSKLQSGLYFGELTSDYHFEAAGPNPYYHWRSINRFSGLIPRTVFPQDLLYFFGPFMTICRIQRNDGEARVKAMASRSWQTESVAASAPRIPGGLQSGGGGEDAAEAAEANLKELAADQIVRLIEARSKVYGLTELVEAILKVEGNSTYRSPEGADGGTFILAGGGELGFGRPSLQTYKKRPIYWLVQSPAGPAKGGFACLIYLHRYTKDTLNLVLNKYFRPYMLKLEARQAQLGLDQLNDALPTRDRTAARKEAEKITKVLKECEGWEHDALLPLAQQRIELDLDDGVKVNYLKLQDVLAPIPGLAAKEE